jgi:hypothetical protein
VVAVNIRERVRELKGIDGAELGVGTRRAKTVIAGETQVWNSRIAVGCRRTLNAEELINVPPLVLIVPPVLPAIVSEAADEQDAPAST